MESEFINGKVSNSKPCTGKMIHIYLPRHFIQSNTASMHAYVHKYMRFRYYCIWIVSIIMNGKNGMFYMDILHIYMHIWTWILLQLVLLNHDIINVIDLAKLFELHVSDVSPRLYTLVGNPKQDIKKIKICEALECKLILQGNDNELTESPFGLLFWAF